MTEEINPRLVSALEKLNITLDNFQNHVNFRSLPARNDDPLWSDIRTEYNLDVFELGALKNARCGEPQQTGKHLSCRLFLSLLSLFFSFCLFLSKLFHSLISSIASTDTFLSSIR